ncbi:MAG: vWA domain-containing protein [Methanothermobacter sp.]|nr:vWA domain-containing protein [Methanothermobacter sp.]
MLNRIVAILLVFFVGTLACGVVSAQDITVNKTATKTGENSATVTIEVTGASETTTSAVDLVFSIDSSGSMYSSDPNNLRIEAAKNFIDKMDPQRDQVGAVNWDDEVLGSEPLTNDFQKVKNFIDTGGAFGGTDLDIGLNEAIRLLDEGGRTNSSKFIIFLTDGEGYYTPSGSLGSPADDAKNKGYIIYTIGLGDYVDETILQEIANVTGGKYLHATDASVLDSIFSEIFQEITVAATNVVVIDVLPDYIQLVGQPTISPTSQIINSDGTTTLTWEIGNLGKDQTWTVSYNILSTRTGNLLTNIGGESKVTYTDPSGVDKEILLPIPLITFGSEISEEVGSEVSEEVQGETLVVAMQETGIPLTGLILGLLLVLGGLINPRKR